MKNELIDKIKNIIATSDGSAVRIVLDIEKVIAEAEKPDFKGKKTGDRFVYRGIEWVILGREQNGVLCVTTKPIGRMPFDKNGNNNWKVSSLREYLNTKFLAKFDEGTLRAFWSDLVADDGDKAYGAAIDHVGLLSCDLYRKYRNIIPCYGTALWTCTPWTCDSIFASNVRYICQSGELSYDYACWAYGVVPACVFIDNQ